MALRNPCKNLKSYDNPFWKNSDGGRKKGRKKKERRKKKEKKSMIIVVPSCLKDADGARTRSDQKSSCHQSEPCSGTRSSCFEKKHLAHKWLFSHWSALYLQEPCWNLMHMISSIHSDFFHNFLLQPEDTPDRVDDGWDDWS